MWLCHRRHVPACWSGANAMLTPNSLPEVCDSMVLGSEVGGRWNEGAARLVLDLVRVRAQRIPAGSSGPPQRRCISLG